MPLLVLIPVSTYLLLILGLRRVRGFGGIADSLVKAHLVIFAFIAAATEILSAAGSLNFKYLVSASLGFLVVCAVFALRREPPQLAPEVTSEIDYRTRAILLGMIVFLLAATLAAALLYPPNTWDSMTYHMPRVMHWISQESVEFYPTDIPRQNYQMPLAEFAILHLQLLSGSDVYANLVQWISYVCLLCLGPLVARELGMPPRQQLVTALVMATVPMAVLQASSTQNDLVVSVFLMAFSLFMLRLRRNFTVQNLAFAAISLGLALLTKGTAYLYGAAIGIALALPLLREHSVSIRQISLVAASLSAVLLVALCFSAGQFHRNYQVYGDPFGGGKRQHVNEVRSATVLGANVLRNTALHLATQSPKLNDIEVEILRSNLGSNLDDPATTWYGLPFSLTFAHHEDVAGNLPHMVTLVFAIPFFLMSWATARRRELIAYSVALVGGALLFCWLLKWQPWHSRLHTPLFFLTAPLIAVALDSVPWRSRVTPMICIAFFLYSVPFALGNLSRSLVSLEWMRLDREQLYFTNRRELYGDYKAVTKMLKEEGAEQVGLLLGGDDWEYPLWALTGPTGEKERMIFQSVRKAESPVRVSSLPTFVVTTLSFEQWWAYEHYRPIYQSETISMYKVKAAPDFGQFGK